MVTFLGANIVTFRKFQHFVLNLGDAVTSVPVINNYTSGWFDLMGRKLSGKPTQKGMYIHDGKTVAVE